MKITKKTTGDVPITTPQEFARASANTLQFKTTVTCVTTSTELATLFKTLNATTRPCAVAILEGK